MLVVPAGILLYMNLGSPEYMSVLYQGAAGRVIMCVALVLYISAFVIGLRILDIHV
jgi:tight adherence protein B